MATATMVKRDFNKVRLAVQEVKATFEQYQKRVISTLQLSADIADYIHGWFTDDGIESEVVERCLDQLRRDSRIYYSRLFFLNDRFVRCERKMAETAIALRGLKDGKARLAMIDDCIDSLLRWQNQRRDFDKCYRQALSEWERAEHRMFEIMAEHQR